MNIDMALNAQRNNVQRLRVVGVMVVLCLVYMAAMASQSIDSWKFSGGDSFIYFSFSKSFFWIFCAISLFMLINGNLAFSCSTKPSANFSDFVFILVYPFFKFISAFLGLIIFIVSFSNLFGVAIFQSFLVLRSAIFTHFTMAIYPGFIFIKFAQRFNLSTLRTSLFHIILSKENARRFHSTSMKGRARFSLSQMRLLVPIAFDCLNYSI
jgi:hypothetical protein